MANETKDVDALLNKSAWQAERRKLRDLILAHDLAEDVKWGKLCYAHASGNVAIIYGMKAYCAIGFFKGSLLDDPDNLLVAPGKHSQAMRQLRFTDLADITAQQDVIAAFIAQAIQVEEDGREVAFTEKDNLQYPDELQDMLADDADYARAFDTLTPGRQRGYILHFSDAKQSDTRRARVERCRDKVMDGKGISER